MLKRNGMKILYALTAVIWLMFFLLLFAGLGMFFISMDNETSESIELWMKISFFAAVLLTAATVAVGRIVNEINEQLDQLRQRISELEKRKN